MTARSIGSVTISFGLVAIPAKLYTAHAPKKVSFNRLDRETGSRVKQQMISEATGRVLKGEDLVDGYEYTPDQFVTFAAEELKALEAKADPSRITVVEVAPRATLDTVHILKSVLLDADKGGDRAMQLFASRLAKRGAVAIGQRGGRTRDELVVLAPGGERAALVLHECLYADEVRSLEKGDAPISLTKAERDLADQLLEELAVEAFDASRFTDNGATRIAAAVEEKKAGGQIVVPPPVTTTIPLDLVSQLKASVRGAPRKTRRAPASQAAPSGQRARAAG
jgi:DNA end-binding protein Ku